MRACGQSGRLHIGYRLTKYQFGNETDECAKVRTFDPRAPADRAKNADITYESLWRKQQIAYWLPTYKISVW